jgi:hypothetical protein
MLHRHIIIYLGLQTGLVTKGLIKSREAVKVNGEIAEMPVGRKVNRQLARNTNAPDDKPKSKLPALSL